MSTSMIKYSYVDLSGYAFTGKSAFTDLLREFDGFRVDDSAFEFALLRTPHGILDLEYKLLHDWSPVRSSEAIRQFKRLIKVYGGNSSFISRLKKIGYHYDKRFAGFTRISNDYLKSLVSTSFYGEWPFATDSLGGLEICCRKILYRIGFLNVFEHEIYLSAPKEEEFNNLTRRYLNEVLSSGVDEKTNTIVLNNSFEPFNSERSLKYFDNAKAIIIDRDPRDIYLSALQYVGNTGKKGWSAASGNTVEDFVTRFKILREKTNENMDPRILQVRFEDLVLNYDNSCRKILAFLEKSATIHKYPLKYFNPDLSKKNVQIWKNTDKTHEINYIEKNLSQYCSRY